MKKVIKIPSLGDAENTEVIEICVNPGDSVGSEDSIVVLESEKAAMDVPASKNGVVKKVLVKIGDEVKEGDDFLEIEISEEEIKEDDSDKEVQKDIQEDDHLEVEEVVNEKKVEEITEQPNYESSASGIYAGPAVRKLAREFGIDLNQVIASGPRNRILKEDLHKFVKSKLEGSSTGIPKMPSIDFSEFGNIEEIDLTKFQKTSALNLQKSWITIPHVTQHNETSIDELLALRKSLMEKYKVKVSPLAFFAKGICRLQKEFPLFNASIDMKVKKIIKKDFKIKVLQSIHHKV
jgi:Pyruvate/2-oxoglutarate dehydrogenase complex, dihydrolipoamide acyltransferase (E2) component, and related enzymes